MGAPEKDASACALAQVDVPQFRDGRWRRVNDPVTDEVLVQVRWEEKDSGAAGRTSLLAWPHDLEALALGHVLLDILPRPLGHRRSATVHAYAERGYHVIVEQGRGDEVPLPAPFASAESVVRAMRDFIGAAGHWDDTGCFHRAGVFDTRQGTLVTRAEDIGRHNCLDRLAGWAQIQETALSDKALLTSARITGSYCAKALRAGFRLLVSRSAVTTAAIDMAREAGAGLAGFARPNEGRFTVFTDSAGLLAFLDA